MGINNHTIKLAVTGIFAVVLILSSCSEQKKSEADQTPEVAVVQIKTQEVVTTTELSGRMSAYLVAEVRPQVGGIIQKRLFSEGAEVKVGQTLFQIDPALYQAALHNAEASLARSEANLSSLQMRADRLRELLADKAVSQQDYDDAAAALKQTQADIQYGRATVETAHINLKYTTITAPIAGRIGRSNVTEGALVTAHQPNALATIQQLDPMYVDVTQSTAELLRLQRRIKEGTLQRNGEAQNKVRLILEDGAIYSHAGMLKFRDVTVDPTTGSVILRIVVPNPKGILLPGMFVRAVVQEGINKKAILVPQQSVSQDPKGNPLAFIVDAQGKAQQRALSVDRAIGNEWLIASGLEPGERVIVEGALKVKPGDFVKAVSFANGKKSQNAAPPAKKN